MIKNKMRGVNDMSELVQKNNPCPCPAEKCHLHGLCDECIEAHKKKVKDPYCMRDSEELATRP